jgi:hypothetical protein
MPNWCSNNFEVTGSKEQIDAFEDFLKTGNGKDWFSFFLPTPAELIDTTSPNNNEDQAEAMVEKYGAADWYGWNVTNWGTKWNCDAQDYVRDDNTIRFWFDSAWSPPVALYEFIESEGFSVRASYYECGMCFVGEYSEGFDDTYEYTDIESLDGIPEHLLEEYNIRESLEDFYEGEEDE